MKIAISELRQKILDTLEANFTKDEAGKVADYLLWAEMSGNSTQGLIKLTGTEPLQNIEAEHEIKVERDTKLSRLINAGKNPAPLVSQIATDVVIEKAKTHGFGIVGVHNIFSSNGAQAFYAERIAKEDFVGIVLARSPAAVAAFGGIDPLFGTNPIGFSFPTNNEPLVFDMATSALTWYGLVLAKARGEQIPENLAIDKDGNPTVYPEAAMNGALLPFDRGYKGAGLGMIVENLAGPLVGAAYGQIEGEWGSLFIGIDPELLIDVAEFKANVSDLIRKIKASRTKTEIRLPGERAQAARHEAEKSGFVEADEAILKQLGYI